MVNLRYARAEFNYGSLAKIDELLLKLEKAKLRLCPPEKLQLQVRAYLQTLASTTKPS